MLRLKQESVAAVDGQSVITTAEALTWGAITHSLDNDRLAAAIDGAADMVEKHLDCLLTRRAVTATYDVGLGHDRLVRLNHPNLRVRLIGPASETPSSLTVTANLSDGSTSTVASSNYFLVGNLLVIDGFVGGDLRQEGQLTITYTQGYTTIPPAIRLEMRRMVMTEVEFYLNISASKGGVNSPVEDSLWRLDMFRHRRAA